MKKSLLFACLIILFDLTSYGQTQKLCQGNLGKNIFKDGDFGKGQDPVLLKNPEIAPGYVYVTQVPRDGEYSMTKNTNLLSGLYGSWMHVGDQFDPNGYIMVVNASFGPGVFYEKTIDSLCPSTLYEFSADMINIVRITTTNHSLPNVSFLIDDVVVFSTGAILQNERWNKYGFTFTTKSGQSSVKLTLRNNAPGGIGNDLALDNISFRPCNETNILQLNGKSNAVVCKESPGLAIVPTLSASLPFVLWQNSKDSVNWTEIKKGRDQSITHINDTTGQYFYRFFAANQEKDLDNEFCRVFSSVFTVKVPENNFYVEDTICDNAQFTFGSKKIDASGNYKEVFKSSLGCDSIVSLKLTTVPNYIIGFDRSKSEPLCTKESSGTIVVNNLRGGHPPYTLTVTDMVKKNYNDFQKLPAGKYNLKISDRNLCSVSDTFTLIDPLQFDIDMGPDLMIFLGEEISINPTANYPIVKTEITPPDYQNAANSIVPLRNENVIIRATNPNGCIAIDSIFIKIDKNIPIYYSNVISLNPSEFANRNFTFSGPFGQNYTLEEFLLFDRFGNILLKENQLVDGIINFNKIGTNEIEAGTYIFHLKLKLIDESIKIVNGTLMIEK
jgi:hypothetical protein